MRETVIVSNRGQLTLPVGLRKRFGIQAGGPVIIEDRNGEIVLKPAVVMEVELYSDEQIAAWDLADQLDDGERDALKLRLAAKKR
ncbi:MAG: AbrB/MazE/SpoVT family DNA-binding domain-containing protein [Verrucomicrobia bacterium]|nr:AbrB/MazE/SpoVT family DNA-binding domain-containing protein [Deltaproteobacteria bacterium]